MEGAPAGADTEALQNIANAFGVAGPIWLSVIGGVAGLVIAMHKAGWLSWLTRAKTEVQVEDFQASMLAALTASQAREDALHDRLASVTDRYDALREEVHQSRFDTHMLRQQMKMFLAGVRQVKAGALPIDALLEVGLEPDAGAQS
ncbi:hypothetical protein [Methylopila sp. M107]|uniref:hypothetical protein n=1 Tax=Methylopila sp. M107 TaxID=1101190 RepID=UPI000374B016|nr:hypothetical protein [Methylopila sp. M107]